jgi:putative phosphonate catabolism associated alcohol dehydrogenase
MSDRPPPRAIARAAVFEGEPRRVTMRSLPVPILAAGEMLVDVLGCTLCGSDLHTVSGRRQVGVPTVLGHEIVGRIAAVADGQARDCAGAALAVGDAVVWAIVASCGACQNCGRGLPQKCERGVKYGHERAVDRRVFTGGLADVCLLAPGTAVVKLPPQLPLELACPASCGTATVAAAFEPAGDLTGKTVAIFGLGLLGLTACGMARTAGAAEVIAIDPLPTRRERALAFGATAISEPDALASDRAAGRIDLALELSGSPAAVAEAIAAAGLGGGVHLVGSVAPAGSVAVDPEQIVRRLLTIRGIHNYAPRHLITAMQFLAAHGGDFPFASLVERWYPLADAEAAFADAAASRAVRIGVRP